MEGTLAGLQVWEGSPHTFSRNCGQNVTISDPAKRVPSTRPCPTVYMNQPRVFTKPSEEGATIAYMAQAALEAASRWCPCVKLERENFMMREKCKKMSF